MTIAERILELKKDFDEVYAKGKADGQVEGGSNPLYYAKQPQALYIGASFPPDCEISLVFESTPNTCEQMFFNANCPKIIKITFDNKTGAGKWRNALSITSATPNLQLIDISKIGAIQNAFQMFNGQKVLETIQGNIDLNSCTSADSLTNMFRNCIALKEVRFKENAIPLSISFSDSPDLSDDSTDSIIDGLIPITDGTARTITFHANVKTRLTDEQKATITTTKGWTLA